MLKVLKEAAENDLYSDLAQEITAIEGDLKDDTQTNLHTYRKETPKRSTTTSFCVTAIRPA